MKVELREHWGQSMGASRAMIQIPQYRVFADNRAVGYIGWKPDSKLLLIVKLGPIETEEINRQVGELMKRKTESNPLPDVPPEMLKSDEPGEDDFDDFNEG